MWGRLIFCFPLGTRSDLIDVAVRRCVLSALSSAIPSVLLSQSQTDWCTFLNRRIDFEYLVAGNSIYVAYLVMK